MRDVVAPIIVAMVVMWPWYDHDATKYYDSNYNHYNHYNDSTVTMAMQQIDLTKGFML